MAFASYLRYILICGAIIIFIIGFFSTLVSWKQLSLGQKMFLLGSLCFEVYVADALREAISLNLGFRWRLYFLGVGEFAYIAYLLEPVKLRKERRGQPMFGVKPDTSDPDKQLPPTT